MDLINFYLTLVFLLFFNSFGRRLIEHFDSYGVRL